MKIIKYYFGFYLKWDAFLLANVFQTFRKCKFKQLKLHPAHQNSCASLYFYKMLSKTQVVLDIIRYINDYLFFEYARTK